MVSSNMEKRSTQQKGHWEVGGQTVEEAQPLLERALRESGSALATLPPRNCVTSARTIRGNALRADGSTARYTSSPRARMDDRSIGHARRWVVSSPSRALGRRRQPSRPRREPRREGSSSGSIASRHGTIRIDSARVRPEAEGVSREALDRGSAEGARWREARQDDLRQQRPSTPARRPRPSTAAAIRVPAAVRARRRTHQFASRFCASSEARKACASFFFSNTCGAMLRRVKAWPSFIRMNALVAKRVMVV